MMTSDCQPSLTIWGDASVAWIAENLRHPLLTRIMLFVSELGQVGTVLFMIALCYWLWNKRYGRTLCYGLFATIFINLWLKNLVGECRPPNDFWLDKVSGFSFPSGHAQFGILLWWGFAYYARNRLLTFLCLIIGLMIALSRSYLGVHYPQDIAIGALLGISTLYLCLLFDKKQFNPLGIFPLWGQALVLLSFLAIYEFVIKDPQHLGIKATSTCFGFWIGCQLEGKYVQFKPPSLPYSLLCQLFIGVLGIALLYQGLSWPIHHAPTYLVAGLISLQHFLIGFWISFVAPALGLRYHFVTSKKF